jgi:hypothetical protein
MQFRGAAGHVRRFQSRHHQFKCASFDLAADHLLILAPQIRFRTTPSMHSRTGCQLNAKSDFSLTVLLSSLPATRTLFNTLCLVTHLQWAGGKCEIYPMPDPLYLSLWFPDFEGPAMLPHLNAVLQQFPFSATRSGITYVAVQPVSWNEASVLERRFSPGIAPEEAVLIAADLIHDDYAYIFEAYWDLWSPGQSASEWRLEPSLVRIIAQGEEFEDATSDETGHIEIDFGLDSLFVPENVGLTVEAQGKIRDNLAKLVEFTKKIEMKTRATSRRLWSESDESLPQKLIARLQRVQ